MTTRKQYNLGFLGNFKSDYSLDESFKNSIKQDSSIFTELKDGKYWDIWNRSIFATARVKDASGVLNPNYHAATTNDISI